MRVSFLPSPLLYCLPYKFQLSRSLCGIEETARKEACLPVVGIYDSCTFSDGAKERRNRRKRELITLQLINKD